MLADKEGMIRHTHEEAGQIAMAYIIAEPCVNVKDGACVDVCPVDCIHPHDVTVYFLGSLSSRSAGTLEALLSAPTGR